MDILLQYLIICPLVMVAGFVDAIAGGGGLISLPAYFLAGVPVHHALATNKMSSASGTLISTIRLCRNTVIRWKLAIPAVLCALTGSYIGTRLTMLTDEWILKHVLMIVLPVVAFFVFRKNSLITEKEYRLEERKEIVDYCINHNRNYKNTAAKFDVSYSQVYSWVKKYDTDGADGLTDRRGCHKTDAEVDELERLKRENLRLKRQLEEKDMVVELLKKVKEFEGM